MNKMIDWMNKRRDSIIFDYYDKKMPVPKIAAKWGITRSRVYQIIAERKTIIAARLAEMPTLAEAQAKE